MQPLRTVLCLALLGAACAEDPVDESAAPTGVAAQAASLAWQRTRVADDLYHYEVTLPIGTGPNAALRLHRVVRERAPGRPRPSAHAAVLLHGDFANFVTNFLPTAGTPASSAPGLARYLASRDVDVWGVDRRWTLPGTDDDTSDFGAMGVTQELDDLRGALALVRATRALDGSGGGRVPLVGFSHGAQLAYLYAAVEASRPAAQRHVDAIAALDFYGALPPDADDTRAVFCDFAAFERPGAGRRRHRQRRTSSSSTSARLARTAPDELSPIFGDRSNHDALALVLGQTYFFAPYAPLYHLLAPVLDDAGEARGYAAVADDAASAWLAGATPHQSMREGADLDHLLCGDAAPITAPLSRIRVPVLYLGAAGGAGELGVYTTTQVSSADVTALVARRLPPGREAEDVGHADLLFASDAPTLAWQPLATWLAAR
jgi:hypothetical protein